MMSEELVAVGKRMRLEDAAAREQILAQLDEEVRAQNLMHRTSTPEGQTKLNETALRLGIGADRLARLLANLATARGLTDDELRRREELLNAFEAPRHPSEWPKHLSAGSTGRRARDRSWSDVKHQRRIPKGQGE